MNELSYAVILILGLGNICDERSSCQTKYGRMWGMCLLNK